MSPKLAEVIRHEHNATEEAVQRARARLVSQSDVEGHSEATICYAWSSPIEGSDRRKFYAVLHIAPVDSLEKTVRAAIEQDFHSGGRVE